jgi:uncharacterized protein with NAD-binding domain and iron-sulfur cluster
MFPLNFLSAWSASAWRCRPSFQAPLAGDYTRQPLLGTREGAVISGQLAARAVLAGGA